MLTFLVVAAVILVVALVFFEVHDAQVMPWSCPACHAGADENIAGEYRHWYVAERDGRVRCRNCQTRFEEHPNGSLVKVREP